MRPDSDQRSHFITESANQTAAEAISIMLAFRPSRCLSQQSAPSGGVYASFTGGGDVFHSCGIPHWKRPTDLEFAQDTGARL